MICLELGNDAIGENKRIPAGELCAICHDPLNGNMVGHAIKAHATKVHAFHKICLEPWLKEHSNCPLCRVRIGDSTPFQNNVPYSPRSYTKLDYAHMYIGCGLILGVLVTLGICAIASVAGIMPMQRVSENGVSSPVASGFFIIGTPIAAHYFTKIILRT